MSDCPRCYAAVNQHHMAKHIDWHSGVRDGFHAFRPGDVYSVHVERCAAEERNSPGGAFWYCGLPADHWYHQPLPEVSE